MSRNERGWTFNCFVGSTFSFHLWRPQDEDLPFHCFYNQKFVFPSVHENSFGDHRDKPGSLFGIKDLGYLLDQSLSLRLFKWIIMTWGFRRSQHLEKLSREITQGYSWKSVFLAAKAQLNTCTYAVSVRLSVIKLNFSLFGPFPCLLE